MNTTTNSSSSQASKAIAAAKKDKNKKRNGGGANRSKALHLRNIHIDIQDVGSDLVLGIITKKLANTRFQVTIPDPADTTMPDGTGRNLVPKPLAKQKLIDVQAAAVDKKAQRTLHARDNTAEPGSFVAVCQSGRNYEIQLLLDRDSVRTYKNQGRIHPKLLGTTDAAEDCGIEFDYGDDENSAAADQIAIMTSHKKKSLARGVEVEKPLALPLKSAKPVDLVEGAAAAKDDDDVNIDSI